MSAVLPPHVVGLALASLWMGAWLCASETSPAPQFPAAAPAEVTSAEHSPPATAEDLPVIPEFGSEAARTRDRSLLRLWKRDIDAYRRLTKDPPEIRGQAARFMRLVQASMLPVPRLMRPKSLAQLGDAILQKGSQDVLIRSYLGWALMVDGDYDRAASLIVSAWKEWDQSGYPMEGRRAALTAYSRMLQGLRHLPDDMQRLQLNVTESLAQYFNSRFEDETISEDLERAVYFEVSQLCGNITIHGALTSRLPDLHQLRLEKTTPWLRSMMRGLMHEKLAWGARGNRFAPEVAPQQWPLFYEFIGKAAQELQNAIDLRPHYPEAYTEMIGIAMAAGRYGEPRKWFEKAVAAQFDFIPAYYAYLTSLYPRWGGDLEQMLAFGRECAATRRSDTDVPFFFIVTLEKIDLEMGLSHKIWRRPGVFEQAMDVLESLENEPARDGDLAVELNRSYLATSRLMVAARALRLDEFRRIYKSLQGQPDERVMALWHRQPTLMLAEFLAWSGPARPFLEEARTLLRAESEKPSHELRVRAKKLLDQAVSHAEETLSKAYCSTARDSVEWRMAFRAGQWMEPRFDENLLTWFTIYGRWERENERTLVGKSDHKTGLAVGQLMYSPPPPLEIEMEIEAAVPRGAFDAFGLGMRQPQANRDATPDYLFLVRYGSNEVNAYINNARKVAPATLAERNLFKVQVADRHVVLWVNGERCLDVRDAGFHPSGPCSFGAFTPISTSRTFRIANLRMRKWNDSEPSNAAAPQ